MAQDRPFGIIYLITNKVSGKQYVGQSIRTMRQRWNAHIGETRRAKPRQVISCVIKRYGAENFAVEEIDQARSRDHINALETEWIDTLETLIPNGYNVLRAERGARIGAIQGGKRKALSAEHREKIRVSLLGNKYKLGKPSVFNLRSSRSKLTDEQVRLIYHDPRTNRIIAESYGMLGMYSSHKSAIRTVARIKSGELYNRCITLKRPTTLREAV